ncbi:hypothetical protein MTP04_17580 [Lysinibacillus sp. PLM2]|nr:hypothetical protein MTP04_17580 [Lysinibacillus sp. PLM2]
MSHEWHDYSPDEQNDGEVNDGSSYWKNPLFFLNLEPVINCPHDEQKTRKSNENVSETGSWTGGLYLPQRKVQEN